MHNVVNMDNLLETRKKLRPSHEAIVATLSSSLIFPRRSVTPSQFPTTDTCLDTRDAIEGGPSVETKHGAAVREGTGRTLVDDTSETPSPVSGRPGCVCRLALGAVWSEFEY